MKKIIILSILILLICPFDNVASAESKKVIALKKQASEGNVGAQIKLGQAYYFGEGVLKDPLAAKFWIRKAYQNGSLKAEKIWENLELWKIQNRPGKNKHKLKKKKSPWTEPLTGMQFIWAPSGCFSMGCSKKCKKDTTPLHKACLSGFWIGQYEVTQAQYQSIMDTNPSRFFNRDNPVENTSWDDAMEFISILNKNNRNSQYRFSLPTEAQWEYACRNLGKNAVFPWQPGEKIDMANCGNCNTDNYNGSTKIVGSFQPNRIGLFDMGGNVAEWCADTYDKNAYSKHRGFNPLIHKKGSSRVVRGGSFADNTSKLKCTARNSVIKFMKSDYIGFRLVRKDNPQFQ